MSREQCGFLCSENMSPFSQNIARTSIKGARASRVMPKPLRLAGKYVVRAMRLSLLGKHVAFFPKHRAHINQGRTRIARDAEAAPTRGKTCRKSNAAFFARKAGRLFPKTSAHINQGRTRLRVMPKPLRLAGKHVAGAMRLTDVIVKMDDVVLRRSDSRENMSREQCGLQTLS